MTPSRITFHLILRNSRIEVIHLDEPFNESDFEPNEVQDLADLTEQADGVEEIEEQPVEIPVSRASVR